MLSEFVQGKDPVFRTDLDLKSSLRDLSRQNLSWPEKSAMMPFARNALGIQPHYEDSWYRSACWGYYAARLLMFFIINGENQKIYELLEPDSDWSAIDQALALGRGAVMLTAHLGGGKVPSCAAEVRGYRVKRIAIVKYPNNKRSLENDIFASSDAEVKTSLIKSVKHLRSGGVIAAASTGRYGRQYLLSTFLGYPLPIYIGMGEMVRLSGAPAFWTMCSWTAPDRLRLIIEPIPTPSAEGEDWYKQFFGSYFDKLAHHMKKFPADLGFASGFWGADYGLPWYQPQALSI